MQPPETRRCTKCGNEIPAWSGGVCPVCDRISQSEKRFWKKGKKQRRSRHRAAQGKPDDPPPATNTRPSRAKSAAPIRRQAASVRPLGQRTRGRLRLDGFNRLLQDVYGRPVYFSHLLTKHGIPQAKMKRWRQDGVWLVRFLRRLKRKLHIALAEVKPGHDPQILTLWYGLDGKEGRSLETITDEMSMTIGDVMVARQELLMRLRKKNGRALLEKMIVTTAQEIERSHEQKN